MLEKERGHLKSRVAWRLKDIFLVTLICLLFPVLAYPLFNLIFRDERIVQNLFVYSGSLLILIVPILWIKKYYNVGKEDLGIGEGRWSVKSIVLIGMGTGLGYFLLESVVVGRKLMINQFLISSILKTLLSTLSISGFLRFILVPISEEVYFRGFLYGYLKSKLGGKIGLCMQALIFSFFHLDFFLVSPISLLFQRFVAGLLSGILYEASGSLYPAIIYHCTIMYLIAITVITHLN